MARWTEERRRQQAEAIRRWKPWEKSTGPKTDKGRGRSSINSMKHGFYSTPGKRLREMLDTQDLFMLRFKLWRESLKLLRAQNELFKIDLDSDI